MMERLFVAVLGTAAVVSAVVQLPGNANDYFLLKLHRELVAMNLQFRQLEQKFNGCQAKVNSLGADVQRLKTGNWGHPKMTDRVCRPTLCKTQLESLEAGLLAEKWRSAQVDEAVEKIKDRLETVTQLAQAVKSTQDRLQAITQLEETVGSTQDMAENCSARVNEIEHREQTRKC